MNTRFALVREKLELTTRKFGQHLNITGGAVTNMEKGTRSITNRTIADICREFNVNEEWLRTGSGEMFIENGPTIISALAAEYNLDVNSVKFIEAFLNLSSEKRIALQEFAINFSNTITNDDKGY